MKNNSRKANKGVDGRYQRLDGKPYKTGPTSGAM